ncbi:MAG TPA: hypothetical protein VK158_01545 [Acidobacteriota bacterium]|nr:hypothetical protein [Acidobacteriota bacterium]
MGNGVDLGKWLFWGVILFTGMGIILWVRRTGAWEFSTSSRLLFGIALFAFLFFALKKSKVL